MPAEDAALHLVSNIQLLAARGGASCDPRAFGEFVLSVKFAELRLAVGGGNRAGTQVAALMAMIHFNPRKKSR